MARVRVVTLVVMPKTRFCRIYLVPFRIRCIGAASRVEMSNDVYRTFRMCNENVW